MKYIPKLQKGSELSLLKQVSNSPADFIQRLKDKNRKSIPNWSNPSEIATHKMSWATDDNGAIIYPQVQNIKGQLTDFTRPPYHKWARLNSAIENGDTLRTTPKMADWFGKNYKNFFPKFQSGGYIQKSDATRTVVPEKISPIKATQEYLFNMRNFKQADAPTTQNYIQQRTPESQASKKSAESKIKTKEKLNAYKLESTKQKQRELQALPIIGLGAMTLAAPMTTIGGMIGGEGINWTSKKLTGKTWGENVLPEAPGVGEWTNPGYWFGGSILKNGLQSINKIPGVYSNYNNLRSIEVPRINSFINSFNENKAINTASNQFTKRNTFYRGVRDAKDSNEAIQMMTTVDGKIRPTLRQGLSEDNTSGVIYSSVNPQRAITFARNIPERTGAVSPVQIKGNNLTEFIDNNLIGNRKDLIFNKQADGTAQLISLGDPGQQVMNFQGFVNNQKLPKTNPLIKRIGKSNKRVFNYEQPVTSQQSIQNPKSNLSFTGEELATGDDLVQDFYTAKKQISDYLNHPVVQKTIDNNDLLGQRMANYARWKLAYAPDSEINSIKRNYSNWFDLDKKLFGKNSSGTYERMGTNKVRASRQLDPINLKFETLPPDIGGQYSNVGNEIAINWNSPSRIKNNNIVRSDVLAHELGHAYRVGESPVEMYKASKLLKPQEELQEILKKDPNLARFRSGSEYPEHYLELPGELYNNLFDIGRQLKGVNWGGKYPGISSFKTSLDLFKNSNKDFVIDALRLNTPRDYKRVWDAMTGRYVIIPAVGSATALLNKN